MVGPIIQPEVGPIISLRQEVGSIISPIQEVGPIIFLLQNFGEMRNLVTFISMDVLDIEWMEDIAYFRKISPQIWQSFPSFLSSLPPFCLRYGLALN